MDNFGQMLGGGSCDECQHHTKGINCHECEDKYYRPEGILPNATEPCIGNISKRGPNHIILKDGPSLYK